MIVLKRILAAMAITSLILAAIVLTYWWRSTHGHSDEFTLGRSSATQTTFTTAPGQVWIKVIDNRKPLLQIYDENRPYAFSKLLGFCLILPGLWTAIKVRSLLPRPPGGRRK